MSTGSNEGQPKTPEEPESHAETPHSPEPLAGDPELRKLVEEAVERQLAANAHATGDTLAGGAGEEGGERHGQASGESGTPKTVSGGSPSTLRPAAEDSGPVMDALVRREVDKIAGEAGGGVSATLKKGGAGPPESAHDTGQGTGVEAPRRLHLGQLLPTLGRLLSKFVSDVHELVRRRRPSPQTAEGGRPEEPAVSPPTTGSDPEVMVLSKWREHCERIEALQLFELKILPEESPDASRVLRQIGDLYTRRLITDEAIYYLVQREMDMFLLALKKGGMLNEFHPSQELRRYYPKGYETVREQVHADMTGKSGRPGQYRCFGFHEGNDPDAPLIAYVTSRFPPPSDQPEEVKRYVQRIGAMHALESGVEFESHVGVDRRALRGHAPRLIEIDTINSHPDPQWRGAGKWLLLETFRAIAEEGQGDRSPSLFYYRFDGFCPQFPCLPPGEESAPLSQDQSIVPLGANDPSYALLSRFFGFRDYAWKSAARERAVRRAPNMEGLVGIWNRWRFGFQERNDSAIECGESNWSAYKGGEHLRGIM